MDLWNWKLAKGFWNKRKKLKNIIQSMLKITKYLWMAREPAGQNIVPESTKLKILLQRILNVITTFVLIKICVSSFLFLLYHWLFAKTNIYISAYQNYYSSEKSLLYKYVENFILIFKEAPVANTLTINKKTWPYFVHSSRVGLGQSFSSDFW